MVRPKDRLQACTGFQWDDGNATKSWDKHDVSQAECEQVFFNQPLVVRRDKRHSEIETREALAKLSPAGDQVSGPHPPSANEYYYCILSMVGPSFVSNIK